MDTSTYGLAGKVGIVARVGKAIALELVVASPTGAEPEAAAQGIRGAGAPASQ